MNVSSAHSSTNRMKASESCNLRRRLSRLFERERERKRERNGNAVNFFLYSEIERWKKRRREKAGDGKR